MNESIKNLKEYIDTDLVYNDFKKGIEPISDFEQFCINHCEDIETIIDTVVEQNRQLKIKNRYFELISDIGFDYDGCNTVDGLKGLIDELVDFSRKGFLNDDKVAVFNNSDSNKLNILYEKVDNVTTNKEVCNDEESKINMNKLLSMDYLDKKQKWRTSENKPPIPRKKIIKMIEDLEKQLDQIDNNDSREICRICLCFEKIFMLIKLLK